MADKWPRVVLTTSMVSILVRMLDCRRVSYLHIEGVACTSIVLYVVRAVWSALTLLTSRLTMLGGGLGKSCFTTSPFVFMLNPISVRLRLVRRRRCA